MNEKIAIALPHWAQQVWEPFFWSWTKMLATTLTQRPGNYTILKPALASQPENDKKNIAQIRNNLVEQAFDDVCTKIIMMDSDQTPPPDTIIKLLSHDLPIVTGMTCRRYPPFDPILLRGEVYKYSSIPDEEMFTGELVEIDATGGGCMCIDMKVFLDVKYPWFADIPADETHKLVGEDLAFWSKVRSEGYKIHCDTSIEIGHLALREINKYDYMIYRKIEGAKRK